MLIHALATIERGAMGNHALALNDKCELAGLGITMYAETIREEFKESVKYYKELYEVLTPDSTVIYQLGNESPVADLLYETNCKLIVNYHNITPARYFSRWNPPVASSIDRARTQMARLAEVTSCAIAVSEFNARELRNAGYRRVVVIPPLFNDELFNNLSQIARPSENRELNLLFVGRIAPHKRQDFLIRVCDYLNNEFAQPTKLTLVGRTDAPVYLGALKELVVERNLQDNISFVEDATTSELASFYEKADAFVCASEHEGFCIPLVEALAASVPVIARDFGAVGETLGGAGVITRSDDPKYFAAAVAELMNSQSDRDMLLLRREEVLKRFDQRNSAARYIDIISEYVDLS